MNDLTNKVYFLEKEMTKHGQGGALVRTPGFLEMHKWVFVP